MRYCTDGSALRLAATTGVESAAELIKYRPAGGDVVMTASALLRHGPEHAAVLLDGLREWMRRKGYTTVEELRGLLAKPVGADETTRERWNYVSTLRQANSTDYGPCNPRGSHTFDSDSQLLKVFRPLPRGRRRR